MAPPTKKKFSGATGGRAAKKQKTDATDTPSPTSSRTAGPIVDVTVTPLPSPTQFVHKHALQTFREVKTYEDFRTAAIFFWYTFFAKQRGTHDNGLKDLYADALAQIPNELFTYERRLEPTVENKLFNLFVYEHNSLLDRLIEKYVGYADKWLASPAGLAFTEDIQQSRLKKTTKPILPLKTWPKYTPRKSEEELEGIAFGVAEIYRLWDFLAAIASVCNVLVETKGDEIIVKEDPDADDDLYGPQDGAHPLQWFIFDCTEDKRTKSDDHHQGLWFRDFRNVSRQVVHQIIQIKAGLNDAGGRKVPDTFLSYRSILQRISSDEDPRIENWPTGDGEYTALSAWVEHFKSSAVEIPPQSLETPTKLASDANIAESQAIRMQTGPPSLLASTKAAVAVAETKAFEQNKAERVTEELLRDHPIHSTMNITQPLSMHLPAQPAVASEFDQLLLNLTLLGKAKLLQLALDSEARRLFLIQREAEQQTSQLHQEIKEINDRIAAFEQFQNGLDDGMVQFREAEATYNAALSKRAECQTYTTAWNRSGLIATVPTVPTDTPVLPPRVMQLQNYDVQASPTPTAKMHFRQSSEPASVMSPRVAKTMQYTPEAFSTPASESLISQNPPVMLQPSPSSMLEQMQQKMQEQMEQLDQDRREFAALKKILLQQLTGEKPMSSIPTGNLSSDIGTKSQFDSDSGVTVAESKDKMEVEDGAVNEIRRESDISNTTVQTQESQDYRGDTQMSEHTEHAADDYLF